MTKDETVKAIAKLTRQHPDEVAATIEAFMRVVKTSVGEGKTIELRGFGKFFPRHVPARKGQDMTAGITIVIPARVRPAFMPSSVFKKRFEKGGEVC
jgi:DNA-binding protein HU-beta